MAKIFISILVLILAAAAFSYAADREVNMRGGGLCATSATSLVKDEVASLQQGEKLTLVIEMENKHLIISAIKLEELPVVYEESTDKDITRFVIRLK
ncbi:MAG: hypothetical protein EPN22_03440 [Nitrospirae bacterium]|nr:MAG: hypothetical protein EPN22_03440 [Nitrospirota bacterium]